MNLPPPGPRPDKIDVLAVMVFRLHRAIFGLIAAVAALAVLVLVTTFIDRQEDEPTIVREEVPSCAALAELIDTQRLVLAGQAEALRAAGAPEDLAAILESTAASLGIDVCGEEAEQGFPAATLPG